jgi:hypothetical protein
MTAKAGQKCTAIRRILVPKRRSARSSKPVGAARQSASATRSGRRRAWGADPPRSDRRAGQGKPDRRGGRAGLLAIRRPSRSTARTRRRGPSCRRCCLHCADPDGLRPSTRHRGLRTGGDDDGISRARPRGSAGQSRRRQPRRFAHHRRSRCRACRRDGKRRLSRAHLHQQPRPWPRAPATARPCRTWSMAGRGAPAAARNWAACAASCTTCSAPPCRAARHLSAITGTWQKARPPKSSGGASVHPHLRRAVDRRHHHDRRAQVTLEDIEHFAHFTGDTFYAHMDEAAAKAEPVLPRPRGPWLPDPQLRRRAVRAAGRRARCWPIPASTASSS